MEFSLILPTIILCCQGWGLDRNPQDRGSPNLTSFGLFQCHYRMICTKILPTASPSLATSSRGRPHLPIRKGKVAKLIVC